jgi:hypothetical protein
MRRLELGLVLFLIGGCRAATVDVAQQPIVGGTPTTAYPFVGYVSADYGSSSSGCTGTLVRDKWFLTAAHCIEESDGKVLGVKVTFEADSDHATMWHTAKSWQQHPNYGKPIPPDPVYYINRGYDCALIELVAPPSGVTPIPYGSFAVEASWVGRAVTQIGYGFTSGNGTGSGLKRELATQIGDVHDGVLGLAENGTGTCQGDSGGPTLYDVGGGVTEVIGVSSYGSFGCPGGGFMSRTELCAAWLDSVAGAFQVADMASAPQPMDMSQPPGSDSDSSSGDGSGTSGGGSTSGSGDHSGSSPKSGCQMAGPSPDCGLVAVALLLLLVLRPRATGRR